MYPCCFTYSNLLTLRSNKLKFSWFACYLGYKPDKHVRTAISDNDIAHVPTILLHARQFKQTRTPRLDLHIKTSRAQIKLTNNLFVAWPHFEATKVLYVTLPNRKKKFCLGVICQTAEQGAPRRPFSCALILSRMSDYWFSTWNLRDLSIER